MNPLLLIAGVLITISSQSAAADPLRYRRAAVGGKELVIGIGARWNKACQSTGVPQVILDAAPEHGFVCIRRGTVKPRAIIFGGAAQCLDTPMDGVQLVYQSRSGFSGRDLVGYTLKFPRGDRSYSVELTVAPAQGAVPLDNPSLSERQPTGVAPECSALVS
jgi:hypothetical protein